MWVSGFGAGVPLEARAEDVAPDLHLVAEAADEPGVPPLVGKQARDRFSTPGDDQAVIAEVVQQGQAPLLEFRGVDGLHRSASP